MKALSKTPDNGNPSFENRKTSPATFPRKRVCHIVATPEGAPWMVQQLRELRDRHGFEVKAIIADGPGNLADHLRRENIPFRVTTFRGSSGSPLGLLMLPLTVLRLARILRREKFDIVQTHIFATMFVGRPAAWLVDAPVRLTMMASPFHLEAPTSRWIDRRTAWMETGIIPACEMSLRMCREIGVAEARLSLIYYSAEDRNFDPQKIQPANIRAQFGWPPETPIVSKVAYFYPRLPKCGWVPDWIGGLGHKGHEDLVNAAPLVLKEFPNAKFLLVGSGWGEAGDQFLQEIKDLVAAKGLQDSVVFPGYRPDANRILIESNVSVQSSLSENLGGTIEGLLMECPMVTTRVGGMPDAVRDGQTGVLVNPKDPKDLARGIIQQLREPEKGKAMAVAGRRLMLDRFTLERTASDLAQLYEKLLREKKQRRFYNPLVSLWRLILAVPIFAYVAFRLLFVDILPIYLPGYIAHARGLMRLGVYIPLRVFYRARSFAYRVVKQVTRGGLNRQS